MKNSKSSSIQWRRRSRPFRVGCVALIACVVGPVGLAQDPFGPGSEPPGGPPPLPPSLSPVFEAGVVDVAQTDRDEWHTIEFEQDFRIPPVVVFGPLSDNDDTPATILLGEVTSESFTVQVREWEYILDGSHPLESFSYFALEPGVYHVGGDTWEARREPLPVNRWRTLQFTGTFFEAPAVFLQSQGNIALEAGVKDITAGGFRARIGEEETRPSTDGGSIEARLNWIAMPSGSFDVEGVNLRIGSSAEAFNHKWRKLEFSGGTGAFPVFVATAQTRNGGDPFTLRYQKLSGRNVELRLGEEQSSDEEIRHTKEAVGHLLISEQSPQSLSQASIEIGKETIAPAEIGGWTRISFAATRWNPVVILGPISGPVENGPGIPRIARVDSDGFSVQIKEWEYQDGVRGPEEISFMAIKEGVFKIGDSTWEAGSVYVNGRSWTTIPFQSSDFRDVPIVLVNQASDFESDAIIPRIRNVSSIGFEAKFFHEEELKRPPHGSELLHYLAVESGEGDLGGAVDFKTWSRDDVKSRWSSISFGRHLDDPYLFEGIQTANGLDPVVVRSRFLSPTGVDVILEEENSKDVETNHTRETVSGLVIGLPENADTDGDGIPNSLEVLLGRDPDVREGDWIPESDPDGFSDPNDSDSDGISDYWEYRHGYNPGDPADADRDDDYDTLTNAEEFEARSNPQADWIEVEIGGLGPDVLTSVDSRYGNVPAAVGSLNDLGQIAKIYEENGELMLARWDLGSWGLPVSLMESNGFSEPTIIRQNNFGLIAASIRNPQDGESKIVAVDSSNNVVEIAGLK